jgi:hypothetical protein
VQTSMEGGRVKACEYVRPWVILHVKLKCRVCQAVIDMSCGYMRAGWNDLCIDGPGNKMKFSLLWYKIFSRDSLQKNSLGHEI